MMTRLIALLTILSFVPIAFALQEDKPYVKREARPCSHSVYTDFWESIRVRPVKFTEVNSMEASWKYEDAYGVKSGSYFISEKTKFFRNDKETNQLYFLKHLDEKWLVYSCSECRLMLHAYHY